ncbi:alkaline phosphatase family protein [Blastopirellula marina]|uniref:Alkaline phosphatase family protein n=1 Tax=Blastopirellula marina TaxID=124 RepID=A0A2S8GB16_9BACT|nr:MULTISPECIES: nucleotide pyrophosphatase/phosphodiesterase family protein [Pirellulaceae]PQO41294.1 alkaline phosphatase family protein [Blastopirellula marina]RCS56318.1 alkaline phosphatase family protein [Bremerella cremea]
MADNVVLLSIPGLRASDVAHMPNLTALTQAGDKATLVPSFPAVTLCVETNIMTGMLPVDHGVVANGWYDREKGKVELWTMGNEAIARPQIWDILKQHDSSLTSAVWFPMLSKRCSADYVCMPAPVHNPDGSESLWCYTRPTEYYGDLLSEYGHFPLKFFWGPLASIPSTKWISDTAVLTAKKHKPNFFYIYLPHLDYQAQKLGPDSEPAMKAVAELDVVLGELFAGMKEAYGDDVLILVASEYTIVPVDHVTYPNRVLREAGLVKINTGDEGETIDFPGSDAFAVADHQLSHIYVKDRDQATIDKVVKLFQGQEGIAEVLAGEDREKYFLNHERSGDVVLVSTANSWQAYYYWLDDANAPKFARTVDIHRKPGYDPVELHVDMATKSIPLDATLVKGSHGAPALTEAQRGVLLSNQKGVYPETPIADTDVCDLVLRQFNI